jgi:circadian clock protein KaiB
VSLVLELFVAGDSVRSRAARHHIERLCESRVAGGYELAVIDVEQDSGAAAAADVVTTPTMIRREPLPEVRLVGDVSDEAAILAALDLERG